MKTDRLIGIITTIQQKGTVTAPYLAEKFGVSRRTINRDIEDICKAGIPLLTKQGAGGGISIMEGFSLDAAVLTRQELSAVLRLRLPVSRMGRFPHFLPALPWFYPPIIFPPDGENMYLPGINPPPAGIIRAYPGCKEAVLCWWLFSVP